MSLNHRVLIAGVVGLVWLGFVNVTPGPSQAQEAPRDPSRILVEIFLSAAHKSDVDAIKGEFAAVGITKVRHKVFQLGNPPTNVAIGRNVPADIARLAIRLAKTYNSGITKLLPEERLASDYIAVGTSIFDELFQYPVSQADVERLESPDLTTEQFHELYRQLADINQRPYR
jgi:hypothetical protein